MLDLVINFLAMTVVTWCLMYLGLWILEKIALLTGSDFFRIPIHSWTSSWKSWSFASIFALIILII
jgi:hypothetical protein